MLLRMSLLTVSSSRPFPGTVLFCAVSEIIFYRYRGAFRVSTGPDVELAVSSSLTMSESHADYERTPLCILGGSVVACLTTVV